MNTPISPSSNKVLVTFFEKKNKFQLDVFYKWNFLFMELFQKIRQKRKQRLRCSSDCPWQWPHRGMPVTETPLHNRATNTFTFTRVINVGQIVTQSQSSSNVSGTWASLESKGENLSRATIRGQGSNEVRKHVRSLESHSHILLVISPWTLTSGNNY